MGGLVAVAALGLALAVIASHAVGALRTYWAISRTQKRLDDAEEREQINRLRHRDIEAFIGALNARRTRLGGRPIPPETLRARQFDTTYAVDSIMLDPVKMRGLKRQLKEAAREGEEPVLKDETQAA